MTAEPTAVWHDVECGGYEADLPLWSELADSEADPILDLGCGTGRVAMHLARRGHRVLGLDLDGDLVCALEERATGLSVEAEVGDARDFELEMTFGLAIAAMQLVQLLDGRDDRIACLRGVLEHLRPGGLAAFAIVQSVPAIADAAPPAPDAHEADGWIYSSLPLGIEVNRREIRISRLRQTVSPAGALSEQTDEVRLSRLDAETLEGEATEAGLRLCGRREIPPTEDHVGSSVVLLRREA